MIAASSSAKRSTSGDASLQNPLEMALTLLQNIPEYGNREVLVCYGSLSTTDPGDIFATIAKLKRARTYPLRAAALEGP